MAESKVIGSISIVTDSETHYDNIGDVDGGFDMDQLKNHVKNYGPHQICERLTAMSWQVWETLREINREKDKEMMASANLNPGTVGPDFFSTVNI